MLHPWTVADSTSTSRQSEEQDEDSPTAASPFKRARIDADAEGGTTGPGGWDMDEWMQELPDVDFSD